MQSRRAEARIECGDDRWLSVAFTRLDGPTRSQIVRVAGLGITGLVLLLTWQAERGQALLRPDGFTVAVGAALLVVLTAGVIASVTGLGTVVDRSGTARAEERPMTEQVKGPASYFPSIEKMYGRPVADWFAIIRSMPEQQHMARVARLKSEHGMGHGHANALVAYVKQQDA